MIRLTSDQAYRVVYYILEKGEFTQTEVHKGTGVSIGRVNQVVSWLLERGYIERLRGRYRLVSAGSLINLFANFRGMKKIASLDIDAPREEVLKFLAEREAVFCLTSALQHYDTYFRDPSISIYALDERIIEDLKKFREGNLRINIYRPDLMLEENTVRKDSARYTSKIRTIIDLFCDNKAYAAERLIKRVFG